MTGTERNFDVLRRKLERWRGLSRPCGLLTGALGVPEGAGGGVAPAPGLLAGVRVLVGAVHAAAGGGVAGQAAAQVAGGGDVVDRAVVVLGVLGAVGIGGLAGPGRLDQVEAGLGLGVG